MIEIKERDQNTVNISISSKSKDIFDDALSIIKSQTTAKYNPKTFEWILPIYSLNSIIDDFNEVDDNQIKIDDSIKAKLKIMTDKRKLLMKIKNKLDGIEFDVPMKEGTSLYPFQKAGAGFLYIKKRALLADTVGLGKTNQALAAIEKRFYEGKLDRCIVACPNSLIKKWSNDIDKFFINREVFNSYGGQNSRIKIYDKFFESKNSYLIASYEKIRIDIEYIKWLIEEGSEPVNSKIAIICDEIQYVKNYNVKRSRAIQKLAYLPKVDCFYGLSATYIENGLENLFGIFSVIDSNIFGSNYYKFSETYLKTDFFGRICGYKNVDDIAEKIEVHTIRRQKEQVIKQLPKVNYIDYRIDLSPNQRSLYDDIELQIIDEINDPSKKASVARANAMTKLGFLTQSCLSTELFDSGEHSAKMDELVEIMEGMDSKAKVIIFCHYTRMVEIICRDLNKAGYKSIFMHGESELGKSSERQSAIDYWSESKEVKVLVTSDILAEGVDLVAASYLVNFDLLWNPAKMDQRNGRIDRISQKSNQITIINLIAKNTVEEKIFNRLAERRELINTIVDGGYVSGRINMLSIENLKELFKR